MGKNERERTGSETKKRGRKRAVGADRARNTNEREEKDTVGFSALHVVAQTNRGTRSLFLSGGCGGGGTKSLRLLPWLSCVFLSFSPFLSLSPFISLPFSPAAFPRTFPSSSLVHSFAPAHRHSLFPFATAVLSSLFFLFSLRLFLCHRTAPVRPCLAPVSLFVRRARSPRLFFSLSLICFSCTSKLNHLRRFFANALSRPSPKPLFFDVQTDRARERASERTRTV